MLERYELNGSHVFLAAGSLNTGKLLLKSQASGALHGANDRIGKGWGTNGDQLMLELSKSPVAGAQGGPACIAATDASNPAYPVTFMHSPVTVPVKVQIQLAMSVPDERGQLIYDAATNQLTVRWPDDSVTPSAVARAESFRRLLDVTGGVDISGSAGKPSVWHPLGGAAMGDACDYLGQLLRLQQSVRDRRQPASGERCLRQSRADHRGERREDYGAGGADFEGLVMMRRTDT